MPTTSILSNSPTMRFGEFLAQHCADEDPTLLDTTTTASSSHDSTTPFSSFSQSPPPLLKPPTKLAVTDLSYTILPKAAATSCLSPNSSSKAVPVLKSVSFTANSSELLAIVGPSGAGKSTLLRIVSGRIPNAKLDSNSSISFNDQKLTSSAQLRKLCGFVTQEDNLLPLLTVRETLLFSSWFRLRELSKNEREDRVQCLMEELALLHVADSFIGDEETRGISGGERRRVSIGVDVIHDPPILLLDEPTSGLDSSSALQVIALLASMAETRQQTIILTIHQPSYRILQYVSSFLLLSSGMVAHFGSLHSLEETIAMMGLNIPIQLNALEFAMEIPRKLEESSNTRPEHFVEQLEPWPPQEHPNEEIISNHRPRIQEIRYLSWRFWKIMYRTKQLFVARLMQAIVGGFGLGSVYLNMKTDRSGVAERLGLFAFTLSFLLSSTVEALPIFLQERRVLMREVSRGMYRVSSYLVANTVVFMPFLLIVAILFSLPLYWLVGLNPSITAFMFFTFLVWMILMMASSIVLFLGAISSDFILGNSLLCLFLGVFFLFSGYFIPKESIPQYWIFMYYVSPYRYPLDSLLINEYWGTRERCFSWERNNSSGRKCLLTGGDVLRSRGLERDTRWVNVGIMLGFFLFYRTLSWLALVRKASKTML